MATIWGLPRTGNGSAAFRAATGVSHGAASSPSWIACGWSDELSSSCRVPRFAEGFKLEMKWKQAVRWMARALAGYRWMDTWMIPRREKDGRTETEDYKNVHAHIFAVFTAREPHCQEALRRIAENTQTPAVAARELVAEMFTCTHPSETA